VNSGIEYAGVINVYSVTEININAGPTAINCHKSTMCNAEAKGYSVACSHFWTRSSGGFRRSDQLDVIVLIQWPTEHTGQNVG